MPYKDPASAKKWYQKNKARLQEYRKQWYQDHKELTKARTKQWKEDHRERVCELNANYRKRHPEKAAQHSKAVRERYPFETAAHQLIHFAVLCRVIKKPNTCEQCKKQAKLQAHHDDYNFPLEVRWLCRGCHREWHDNNKPIRNRKGLYKK